MLVLDPLKLPLEGVRLIEASAGTGKTYTITTLLLRLIVERRLGIQQILVVTFTRAATAELRERVRRRLKEALDAFDRPSSAEPALLEVLKQFGDRERARRAVAEALHGLDEAAIFTIHGFCQRVLQEHAFESGARFDLELTQDTSLLISEVVSDYWVRELSRQSPAFVAYLAERRFDLGRLTRLCRMGVAAPEMPIVPRPEDADVSGAIADYYAARAGAALLWRKCRSEVVELLSDDHVLNQHRYSQKRVAGWAEQLDALLASDAESLTGWFPEAARFSETQIADATKRGKRTPRHMFFRVMDELVRVAAAARQELAAQQLSLIHQAIAFARSEVGVRKRRQGVQSFDDLLHDLKAALSGAMGPELARAIRSRYPAALIDEFQDTDPVQYEIFQRIYSGRDSALFLIGDPKQAIYAFRGADIFGYLRAARDASDNAYTLGTNYRSDPRLIHALNTLFSRTPSAFAFNEIEFTEVTPKPNARERMLVNKRPGPAFEVLFVPRDGTARERGFIAKRWITPRLPRMIANEIARLLKSPATIEGRRVVPGDIAVLTRTNKQAMAVQEALRELRIPSVLHGDASVLQSREAGELGRIMRAIAEPGASRLLRSALATTLFGVSADDIYQLSVDERAWEQWTERFVRWNELWEAQGFIQAFRQLLADQKLTAQVLGLPDGERRLTNLYHLAEVLHQAATERHLGVAGLMQWFDEVRFDERARQEMAPETTQIRLERDGEAVQLTTMHKSKGLEYPVVYCPYLWDGTRVFSGERNHLRFHDPEDNLVQKLHVHPEGDQRAAWAAAETEAFAENVRLCYVALTRARHRVSVVWGGFNACEHSPLAHLFHHQNNSDEPRDARARVHQVGDRELRQDLARLSGFADGSIVVRDLTDEPGPEYGRRERSDGVLSALSASRKLDLHFRTTSFSALSAPGASSQVEIIGLDRDQGTGVELLPVIASPLALHEFPRGARAGDLLHEILEHADFQEREPEALPELVESTLARHAFDVAAHKQSVCHGLSQVFHTPLAEGLRLRDVPQKARLAELEFVFPVCQGARVERRLSAAALGDVFARHATQVVPASYADSLRQLPFAPLAGFLRGFVDLVFEHRGRFYVVDYKSNALGPSPRDFGFETMQREMAHHHYFLQYHVYSLALHRYLEARLPGYDYERQFGGVYYLFLRGMAPEHPPGSGVFQDRPSAAMVAALSQLISDAGSSASARGGAA